MTPWSVTTRLMNNLLLMVLKKLGLPTTAIKCLGELWSTAVHLIKTVYGTSDITYSSMPKKPLYGPGQGSMCGPLFWLLTYWLIVNSLDPHIPAMKFISACRQVITQVTGSSFVDDTGLGVTMDPISNELQNDNAEERWYIDYSGLHSIGSNYYLQLEEL